MKHIMHLICSLMVVVLFGVLLNDPEHKMRPGIVVKVFAYMLFTLALAWFCVSAERAWNFITNKPEE